MKDVLKRLELSISKALEENVFTDEWTESNDRRTLELLFDDDIYSDMAEAAVKILESRVAYYKWLQSQDMIND